MTAPGLLSRLEGMLAAGQDSAMLRFSLGSEYLRAGDAALARTHLSEAVELDPAYSAAWKMLGKATAEAGDALEAGRIFAQGIKVAEEQGDVQAAKEMAVFLRRLKRTRPSKADVEK